MARIKDESPLIGYTEILEFDDKAFEKKIRAEELQRARRSGKVWTRGEPLESIDPVLRVFIEKQENPGIVYPLALI